MLLYLSEYKLVESPHFLKVLMTLQHATRNHNLVHFHVRKDNPFIYAFFCRQELDFLQICLVNKKTLTEISNIFLGIYNLNISSKCFVLTITDILCT